MNKSLKTILIVGAILVVVLLVIFKGAEIGSMFAALAGGFAAFRAKLFNSSTINVEEETAAVEQEHLMKRQEWQQIKEEYDSKFNAIKARMDYLDYKSATIAGQIRELDDVEKEAIAENSKKTNEELLNWLRN